MANKFRSHLTGGTLLARNAVWNLIGTAAPMLVALFCIPALIHGLGKERFGVLTLSWTLLGYAGLFDLGVGRALTQLVADKLGTSEEAKVASLVWTSLTLMLLFGIFGAMLLILLAGPLVHRVLQVPASLQNETVRSFYMLGISIPLVLSTAGLRGVLEAHQRFGWVNALRVPMTVFSFISPLLVLPFTQNLFAIVSILVAGRLIGWFLHIAICLKIAPELKAGVLWSSTAAGSLLRTGGWMTVTNLISPLMVSLDRFIIGALVSMVAVTYYATPYEVVTKLWVIPGALISVIFPAFSMSFRREPDRTAMLYSRSVKFIYLSLFPFVLLAVVFAREGLSVWLGAEFASHSYQILQILAFGVLLNSLAFVPITLIQGVGRPDVTAFLHLFELPLYLGGLWILVHHYGVLGAAVAWSGRILIDTAALFALAERFSPTPAHFLRRVIVPALGTLIVLAIATLPSTIEAKSVFVVCTFIIYGLLAWFRILSSADRSLVLSTKRQIQVSA